MRRTAAQPPITARPSASRAAVRANGGMARRPTLMNTELPPHSSASRVTSATTAGVGASTLRASAADFMRRHSGGGNSAGRCGGVRSSGEEQRRSRWLKLLPTRLPINAA